MIVKFDENLREIDGFIQKTYENRRNHKMKLLKTVIA